MIRLAADVNFLQLSNDEYSKEVKALGFPRAHRHKLFCLRQELIDAFFEARYMMFIKLAAFHLQQLSLQKSSSAKPSANSSGTATKAIEEGEESNNEEKVRANETKHTADDNSVVAAATLPASIEAASEGTDEYKKIVESITSGEKSEIDSTKEIVRKAALAVGSLKDSEFDIRFNPDVYSESVKHSDVDAEKLKKERQLVKDAAEFVLTVQIPSFVSCVAVIFTLLFLNEEIATCVLRFADSRLCRKYCRTA